MQTYRESIAGSVIESAGVGLMMRSATTRVVCAPMFVERENDAPQCFNER